MKQGRSQIKGGGKIYKRKHIKAYIKQQKSNNANNVVENFLRHVHSNYGSQDSASIGLVIE